MELVYLWVEDYKNIHEQGFNFSPRFNCKYDPDSNELTIDENDDYIENFFGDNINVTAIVGKNGSGKSSALTYISKVIGDLLIEKNKFEDKYTYIFIFKLKNVICVSSYLENISINNHTLYEKSCISLGKNKINILKNELSCFYYREIFVDNISLDYLPSTSFITNRNRNTDRINDIVENEQNNLIYYAIDNVSEEQYKKYFHIDEINISMYKPIEKCFDKNIKPYLEDLYKNMQTIKDKILFSLSIEYLFVITQGRPNSNFCEYNTLDEINYDKLDKIFNSINEHNKKDTYSNPPPYNGGNNSKECEKELSGLYETIKEIDNNIIEDIFNINDFDFSCNNPIGALDIQFKIGKKGISFLKKNKQYRKLVVSFLKFFSVSFKDSKKNVPYSMLSAGEKELIKIRCYVKNSIYLFDRNSILILLDEPNNHLHPDWQKRFLDYIIYFLKVEEKEIHFIFTTHSPFLLSDIPKQNIIFLDTYKENNSEVKEGKQKVGNCRVLPHDEVFAKKQTFGANIHTLLSDSFFMEDGLMGEFAKGKINKIIKFHKIVEKKKHQSCLKKIYESRKIKFWNTQSIIGEEYLKQVIKNHLIEIEKVLLGKDATKQEEIARTKEYLKSLEND